MEVVPWPPWSSDHDPAACEWSGESDEGNHDSRMKPSKMLGLNRLAAFMTRGSAMPVSARAFGSVTFVEELRFEGPKPLRLSMSNGMMSHDVKTSPEIQELYTEVKVKQSCWHSRFLHFLRLTPHAYCLLFDWFHPHHDFFQKLALLKPMVSWRFFAVYFYFRRWFSTKL